MTRLLSSLILAFATILAVPVVYFTSFIVFDEWVTRDESAALVLASFVTGGVLVAAWVRVWYRQVVWDHRRRVLTAASVLFSLIFAGLIGLAVAKLTRREGIGIFIGSMFGAVGWLASTAIIWRETARERCARLQSMSKGVLTCPRCGYNLTGLRGTRCPECGAEYSLDELVGIMFEQISGLGGSARE